MKKSLLRLTVASGILCLLPVSVQAQENQPRQATEQQPQDQASPQAGQAQQREQRPERGQAQQREQQQRRRVQAEAQRKRLESFLVNKLIMANQAEIQLSQMAREMVQNKEVKKFAEKLVQDHQKLNQKLMQSSSAGTDRPRSDRDQTDRSGQNREGQAPAGQRGPDRADRTPAGQLAMRGQGPLPQQLMRVDELASEIKLLMIKDLLSAAEEGDDLDMAFVGIQIVEHTSLLAELEAMIEVGSVDFKRLVRDAHESTREHLEQAKELKKKLKGSGN